MDFRLTKQHRLLSAGDFSAVFEGAKLKAGAPQLLLLGLITDREHARLGLVISKKNVGDAVARNRVKRLCREVFRHQCAGLPGIDIVVLARPGLAMMDNAGSAALLGQLLDTLATQHKRRMAPSMKVPSNKIPANSAGTTHADNSVP